MDAALFERFQAVMDVPGQPIEALLENYRIIKHALFTQSLHGMNGLGHGDPNPAIGFHVLVQLPVGACFSRQSGQQRSCFVLRQQGVSPPGLGRPISALGEHSNPSP